VLFHSTNSHSLCDLIEVKYECQFSVLFYHGLFVLPVLCFVYCTTVGCLCCRCCFAGWRRTRERCMRNTSPPGSVRRFSGEDFSWVHPCFVHWQSSFVRPGNCSCQGQCFFYMLVFIWGMIIKNFNTNLRLIKKQVILTYMSHSRPSYSRCSPSHLLGRNAGESTLLTIEDKKVQY